MYLPYLRGKQFELIALRELCSLLAANKEKVSPIIEPVKDSSTLRNSLECLAQSNINFNVIVNPSVGNLINKRQAIYSHLSRVLKGYSNWQAGVLIDQRGIETQILEEIKEESLSANGFTLVHNSTRSNIPELVNTFNNVKPIENNVINFGWTNRRYYREFARDTIVSLDDFFVSQAKNADYLEVDESNFSEEHLYYRDDGFKGFSDFLTIGENYSETGFLPYAVAIHLSYADEENKIRVKHFVSDSNDDASDIGGKFAEALEKLVQWCNQNNIDTMAVREFRDLHRRGHFPGLGSIKKLCVMHHIELVLTLI